MPRLRRVVVAGLVLGVLGASGVVGRWAWFRLVPPAAGEGGGNEEEKLFRAAAGPFAGSVVWASTRSGDHEIWRLDLAPGAEPRFTRLTRDPHVDTFPRFSPDGRRILFDRSREPWVSARDPDPWDVWIMEGDGSGARRVAEKGFHASFTPDGSAVVFARAGQVVRHELEGGREEVLLDAAREVGGWLQEPDLRATRLAGTVRGGARTFGVYDLAARRFREFRGDACQIAWWPGRPALLWVEGHAGVGGTRILEGTPDGRQSKVLMDLPGKRSHEYFPRLSRDGAWLVWGAAAEGHEHDRADYEIFLWKVGDPFASALRLTHHSGNDQWPDVLPSIPRTRPSATGRSS